MSIYLMTEAFKTPLPTTQKFVFVALCDNASDEGECYPSVSTLCKKTSLSERAVQGAIKRLVEMGYMSVKMRNGHSTIYRISPVSEWPDLSTAPAPDAPPPDMHPRTTWPPPPTDAHPTPAGDAGDPRTTCTHNHHITINEPSVNQKTSGYVNVGKNVSLAVHLRKLGVNVNGSNPILIALAEQGVSDDLLTAAVDEAKRVIERPSLNYIVGILKRWKESAASVDVRGATVPNRSKTFDWRDDNAVLAKGRELGLYPGVGESWHDFKSRISVALDNKKRIAA